MVNHGLSTGMLFVMVGMLVVRGGSRLVDDYGGVAKIAPLLAGCLLLAGLSSLALPGTNSFVSEFLVLVGSYPREPVFTVLATVGIVFAALYVLWFYQRTMQGPLRGAAPCSARSGAAPGRGGPGTMLDPEVAAKRAGTGFPDLTRREIAVLTPLIFLIMVLGFVPGPVLDVITPSVVATMNEVGLADPVGGVSGEPSSRRSSSRHRHPGDRLRGHRPAADRARRGLRGRAGRGVPAPAPALAGPGRAVGGWRSGRPGWRSGSTPASAGAGRA